MDAEKLKNYLPLLALLAAVLSIFAGEAELIGPTAAKYFGLGATIAALFARQLPGAIKDILTKESAKDKKIISLFLLCALCLPLTACPKGSTIKKAYNASGQIAKLTETAAVTIGDLFTAKIISFEAKESLIAKLKIVRDNGKRFHAEINALYAIYKDKLPDEKINALDILFNSSVIVPFIEILTTAGLLSAEAGNRVLSAILLLKTAILTVAGIFGNLRSDSASFEFYKREAESYV